MRLSAFGAAVLSLPPQMRHLICVGLRVGRVVGEAVTRLFVSNGG
jgi:hypothetical protein